MRQFQRVPTPYDTEKRKEAIFKLTLNELSCPFSDAPLEHVKLPINVKIPVTIWQIVHINMTALLSNLI